MLLENWKDVERDGKLWKAMEGYEKSMSDIWIGNCTFRIFQSHFGHYLSTMCKILHIICDQKGRLAAGLGT